SPLPSALSLHDALPISSSKGCPHTALSHYRDRPTPAAPSMPAWWMLRGRRGCAPRSSTAVLSKRSILSRRQVAAAPLLTTTMTRSEEHTSELQSRFDLV